jgi:RpiR family transcriptional regulator, carbohydrate utilization regulator
VQQQQLIKQVESSLPDLRPSERKVADFVLANSDQVIRMRIVDLAASAQVSEPTVVRFCRAVGCEGFQAFKLALAQTGTPAPKVDDFNLSELHNARQYTAKVFESTMETLLAVKNSIDTSAIEAAVDVLCTAGRVEFYGFGASSSVAIDAQHKFFRLQIPSAAHSDPHIQAMSAMSLGEGDAVVAISQTGRSQSLLDAMALASEAGAITIGLAPTGTPVARRCRLPIHIDVKQDPEESYTPLPSRIAHLAVIDVLAAGVSKIKGPNVTEHLQRLNRGLQSLRTK